MVRTEVISAVEVLIPLREAVSRANDRLVEAAAGGRIISITSSIYGDIYILAAVVEFEDEHPEPSGSS